MLNLLAFDVANAAKTVLGIGGLIFVHELGHFLVGRFCGVRAEAFSIGFGPVLAKWTPGETEYRLSAIPLGGYVKFLGESTEDGAMEALENAAPSTAPTGQAQPDPVRRGADRLDPRSFHAATYPRKAAIMLAGVTMNVIIAFLLFVAAFQSGVEVIVPVVGVVAPGLPAEKAGLRPGDRIVRINGSRILDFEDVANEAALAEEVEVEVRRDGLLLPPFRFATHYSEELGHRMIGVSPPRDQSGEITGDDGSPAARAGLTDLRRVVAVGGQPVADLGSAWSAHLAAKGDTVPWTFEKGGERSEIAMPTGVWRLGIAADRDAPPGDGFAVTPVDDPRHPSPARDAGIPPHVRLVAADGASVQSMEDVRNAVLAAGEANREVVLRWRPTDGGEARETSVRPVRVPVGSPDEIGILVPAARETLREENVLSAAVLGVDRTHRWVMRILSTLRSLFTGGVSARKLQGPVALARMTYERADTGWSHLFLFLGMISMNLAVLNVLPVPLLDGGQLALITVERIRGRPLPERVSEGIQWTGLALLVSFMLFVIVNDIRNF